MNIAIIGTGIAGLTAARLLQQQRHHITLFEASDKIGGHTNTLDVDLDGARYAIDTGFIVFNDWTYPNFIRLLDELGVASQPTEMSFSVACDRSGLEYNGNNLNTLFAQRRNLLRPRFYRMLGDILRFNREAPTLLDRDDNGILLGDFLHRQRYGEDFRDRYIVPMAAAIWSTDGDAVEAMPARFFVRFFLNHGLLSVNDRPQWRVIEGGSSRYLDRLTAPFRDRIRVGSPVRSVTRDAGGVELRVDGAEPQRFDQVVIAAHSDQALAMLSDPSAEERDILGAIPYQSNEVVLHTDARLLPRRRLAWAAWNYRLAAAADRRVTLTYNMNILQGLSAPQTFCVTMNDTGAVNPKRVLARMVYHHPVFTAAGVAAQRRCDEISGRRRTWYCGAYWGYGFHEDGVNSALRVGEGFSRYHLAA